MPFATNQGIQLAYDVSGAGADLLLVAGRAERSLWAQVRPTFDKKFRTIAFDNRESGASGASPNDYGVRDLPCGLYCHRARISQWSASKGRKK